MIKDIDHRVNFWERTYKAIYQGDSVAQPFDVSIFNNKKVLEIGPGEGRQFQKLFHICSEYSVADICQKVIELPIYSDCKNKILLTSFSPLQEKFDIIHCWYVIHHVLTEEIENFIDCVSSGLLSGGIFYFNYPLHRKLNANDVGNNGTLTSPIDQRFLLRTVKKQFTLESLKFIDTNCAVLLCRKI